MHVTSVYTNVSMFRLIPYSVKLWRERISRFCGYSQKFSPQNLGVLCPLVAPGSNPRHFSPQKTLFSTNPWNFSPVKVSRYTVVWSEQEEGEQQLWEVESRAWTASECSSGLQWCITTVQNSTLPFLSLHLTRKKWSNIPRRTPWTIAHVCVWL